MNQLRAALQERLNRPGPVTRGQLRALMFENPSDAPTPSPVAPFIYPNPVQAFLDERPRYVAAARQQTGNDSESDYHRWQGHMEARRQLATALGLTVPMELGDTATPKPQPMHTPEVEQAFRLAETITLAPGQLHILRGETP